MNDKLYEKLGEAGDKYIDLLIHRIEEADRTNQTSESVVKIDQAIRMSVFVVRTLNKVEIERFENNADSEFKSNLDLRKKLENAAEKYLDMLLDTIAKTDTAEIQPKSIFEIDQSMNMAAYIIRMLSNIEKECSKENCAPEN